jgi:outer membrane protein assembly factor BamB
MRRLLLICLILLLSSPAVGAVHFIKWNHANGSGDDRIVAAIDLDSGKVLWEKKLKKEVNFVVATDVGVLVGSDDGSLHLLREGDGRPVWSAELGKEVNEFHKDTGDGFLVSHDKQVYWLVRRDGIVRAAWK